MTFRTAPAIAEARALLALAVPLMLAQLAQMLMGYTDTLMVARVGALELAAVGTGLALWHPLYLAVTGLLMAESALIARLAGAGRADAAGGLRRHA
ncbi:MAG TPA: MATE family efflux transporter, partial [Plasticicumulans sp.]